jgi:hypothetical protein
MVCRFALLLFLAGDYDLPLADTIAGQIHTMRLS